MVRTFVYRYFGTGVLVVSAILVPLSTGAQVLPDPAPAVVASAAMTAPDFMALDTNVGVLDTTAGVIAPAAMPKPASGRGVLLPMYASYGVLQALDIYTTHRALGRGAVEGNAMMGSVVKSPVAFSLLKAGSAGATIFLVDRLSKKHKMAAIGLAAALNGAYAALVAHNYRVGSQLR